MRSAVLRNIHDVFQAVADAQRLAAGGGVSRMGEVVLPTQDGYLFTLRAASGKGAWKLEVQRKGWTPVDEDIAGAVRDFLSAKAKLTGQQVYNDGRLHEFFFTGTISLSA